ncbi:MAG: hypothetical protein MI920_29080 [Kiloniellales bacterium]|nr:hypothetical protein [Kiloniellales bacterium]
MTLPTNITSASSYDAGTDDPKQARAQLKGLHDDVEQINDHLKASPFLAPATPLGIGDGLESSGGNAQVKLQANAGLARAASGLALDLSSLAVETDPQTGDIVAIRDTSAPGHRSMSLVNLLKVINALTEDATPDPDADFIPVYDASATTVKKVKVGNVGGGGFEFGAEVSPSPGAQALEFGPAVFTANFDHYVVMLDDVRPTTNSALIFEVYGAGNWVTAGGAYRYSASVLHDSGVTHSRDTAGNFIRASSVTSVTTAVGRGLTGIVELFNTNESTRPSPIKWSGSFESPGGMYNLVVGNSFFVGVAPIQGFRVRTINSSAIGGFLRCWASRMPNS